MFSRKDAQKILKEEQTPNWLALCLSAIESELPAVLSAAAYALLNHDAQGKAFVFQPTDSQAGQHHREAIELSLQQLADLSSEERSSIFSVLVPHTSTVVESAWQLLGNLPYQIGWQRKAFRAPTHEQAYRTKRLTWVRGIIPQLARYREKDLTWFAAWTPYLASYTTQPFGVLFAAAIDKGGEEGNTLFDILVASAYGKHAIGKMGRHVTTGLLVAARPDGWNCIERLLLDAQREEGLRQVILETVDEAHPQAFRRMLQLILEQDLLRFSATIRAADVWFGFGKTVEDAQALRNALRAVLPLLDDQVGCREAIAHGNPQEVYFALWATAFTNAMEAISAAFPALSDPLPERRLAAVHLLGLLNLPEARDALLPLLDDPDLRVAIHAFAGIAPAVSTQSQSDLFEQLQRLLGRMSSKSQKIKSGIWAWLEISAFPSMLLHTMMQCLGERDPRCLIAYLSLMDNHDRITLAKKLVTLPVWDEEVRGVLYKLVGERSKWVRSQARELLATRPLDEASTLAVEQLLTRKDVDLRRGLIALLLKGNDEAVLNSASRLLALPHALQRLAGLDLLNGLVSEKRKVERAATLAQSYQDGREVVTPEEATLVGTICAASRAGDTPTPENVLGLIVPDQRTPSIPPRRLAVTVDTSAARKCLRSLDALIEEHRTTPVVIKTWRGSEEMLLGNVNKHSPYPNPAMAVEAERTSLPLAEVWLEWERERSAALRDDDGLELLRAALLLKTTRAAKITIISGDNNTWPGVAFQGIPVLAAFVAGGYSVHGSTEESAASAPAHEQLHLRYSPLMGILILWLIRRQGMSIEALNFLLDAAEAALASVEIADLVAQESDEKVSVWRRQDLRTKLIRDGSLVLLQQYRAWHRTLWEPEHYRRYWQLLHWLDEPTPGLARMQPSFELLMDAYRVGAANEVDILDHLGGPVMQLSGARHSELRTLSTCTPSPLVAEYPVLSSIVAKLRARILEIELGRGELPTAATNLAFALRYSGGTAIFVRLVTLLHPTDLARGYTYDNQGKGTTFSHLLRVSYPGPEESSEEFACQVREARLDSERLVAAALYAPQWAHHVEYVLGWPSLTDAVWWIYAHTRGNNWSVDEEVRKTWQAQVAERTALNSEELLAGAVDVTWFWNSYRGIGAERWERVYAAAKYVCNGTGHGRARLYADAMRGKVSAQELRQRMFEKRQQDVVRALGLAPLPATGKEREAEIAERYRAFQEFKRTGRTFGAQRRVSEETAIRIGMENLARTAGFSDPLRLQWAMEAQTATELRQGALTVTEGDFRLTLELDNSSAEPRLTIAGNKGKVLKALPARLKKHQDVIALVERKREIEQLIARMRTALETAMCRGDRFTASEIMELLAHPVLSRLLLNLIFVQGEKDHMLGYPVCCESEAGPQLFLRDYAGAITSIDRSTEDLRIAHPYDLFIGEAWHNWQHECFTASRAQPFKQVFRELYVCTRNELRNGDEALSQRYSGQQVQPRQAHALLGQRGWVAGDEEGVRRTFHAEKLTAHVSFVQGNFTPAGVEGLTVDQVFFLRRGESKPVPLASIPPHVFSETMRDLDLMVSIAHSGGVDPEATASTVEMRSSLVSETCALLSLENVTIRSAHALIEGTLGHYTVHLGSAVVHRQPGGTLCIIPVHAQHRGRIFLPFADNDPKTAEVITKVITLARDKEIKDPSILEQIL
jgi:Family of unknown function (DUF5724)/Domain of unknown function (DUF4132)